MHGNMNVKMYIHAFRNYFFVRFAQINNQSRLTAWCPNYNKFIGCFQDRQVPGSFSMRQDHETIPSADFPHYSHLLCTQQSQVKKSIEMWGEFQN